MKTIIRKIVRDEKLYIFSYISKLNNINKMKLEKIIYLIIIYEKKDKFFQFIFF